MTDLSANCSTTLHRKCKSPATACEDMLKTNVLFFLKNV